MASTPATCVARDFAAHARGLDHYIARIERGHLKGAISERDLERVYAGGMLSFANLVEQSLERLFIGLLTNRLRVSSPRSFPRITVGSPLVARELLLSGRNYVDWLPYNNTKELAKRFLRNGYPFLELSKTQEENLETVRIIRNAIAHDSDHAIALFNTKVIGTLPIPPTQRSPVGYLRGQHAGKQNRFNVLLAVSVQGMTALCS